MNAAKVVLTYQERDLLRLGDDTPVWLGESIPLMPGSERLE